MLDSVVWFLHGPPTSGCTLCSQVRLDQDALSLQSDQLNSQGGTYLEIHDAVTLGHWNAHVNHIVSPTMSKQRGIDKQGWEFLSPHLVKGR